MKTTVLSSVFCLCEPAMAARHVVVFPFPIPGHYIPMSTFSHALACYDAGIRVTIVHTEANLQKLQEGQGQERENLQIVSISDGLPLHFDRTSDYQASFISIQQMGPALLGLLQELHAACTITCLVSDPNFPWVLDVANQLSLPLFLFLTDSAAVSSVSLHARRLLSDGFIGKGSPKDASELVHFIPGVPALPAKMLPFPRPEFSDFFFQIRLAMFDKVGGVAGVLLNTFYELEREAIDGMSNHLSKPVLAVGPCLPDFMVGTVEKREGEADKVLRWLDERAPASVMYVCFGSLAILKEEQIREIWEGLRASEQPFLWATRSALAKELAGGMRIEGGVREQGVVVEWAPQQQVLCHPSVGGFMTHCGWNSVLEGMSAGVPMLCCPQFLDQPLTCTFIVQVWRVGIKLVDAGEPVERRALERLVRLMLLQEEGKHLRQRALELREAARASLRRSPPGSSIQNLHSFIKILKNQAPPFQPRLP